MPARFLKVNDNLFRGGEPSLKDLKLMNEKIGINRVVSLDGRIAEKIKPYCEKLGIKHFILPIEGLNPVENVEILKNNLLKILEPKGYKTYVHCYHGKDRTGMACAMYNIAKGKDIKESILEAINIGMGLGLDKDVKKMYYKAVLDFGKNNDTNFSDTIVDIQRSETSMNNMRSPAQTGEMSVNFSGENQLTLPNQMSFAPYSDPNDTVSPVMNISASSRVYNIIKFNDLLKPGNVWHSRQKAISKTPDSNGNLYSAEISSDVNVIRFRQPFNKFLLQSAKLKGADVVFFSSDVVFILNPNALINIREEGDSNYSASLPQAGQRGNYDGLAPYSFPGSGGLMESGYGGFAGPVQLPYTNF